MSSSMASNKASLTTRRNIWIRNSKLRSTSSCWSGTSKATSLSASCAISVGCALRSGMASLSAWCSSVGRTLRADMASPTAWCLALGCTLRSGRASLPSWCPSSVGCILRSTLAHPSWLMLFIISMHDSESHQQAPLPMATHSDLVRFHRMGMVVHLVAPHPCL